MAKYTAACISVRRIVDRSLNAKIKDPLLISGIDKSLDHNLEWRTIGSLDDLVDECKLFISCADDENISAGDLCNKSICPMLFGQFIGLAAPSATAATATEGTALGHGANADDLFDLDDK